MALNIIKSYTDRVPRPCDYFNPLYRIVEDWEKLHKTYGSDYFEADQVFVFHFWKNLKSWCWLVLWPWLMWWEPPHQSRLLYHLQYDWWELAAENKNEWEGEAPKFYSRCVRCAIMSRPNLAASSHQSSYKALVFLPRAKYIFQYNKIVLICKLINSSINVCQN